jgi:hypothetical protein
LNVQALSKEDFTIDVAIKIYPIQLLTFVCRTKDQHQLRINIVDINGRVVLENKINSGGQIDILIFQKESTSYKSKI